jgi:AcrR family transcriptional regulator
MARATAKLAREEATGPGAETRAKTKSDARAQPRAPDEPQGASAPRKRRSLPPEARRAAILAAALEEFSARGYEGARLEDVAKRAGIAKGTIYLYFADKEALFQDLVRSMVNPILGMLQQTREIDLPARALVELLIETFLREIYGTRRKDIIRLIFSEGPRFPAIAEFYHREVISRILGFVRPMLARAVARGELPDDTFVRFPQLLIAPGLVGILWSGLFEKFEPLDVAAMMRAHVNVIFAGRT